MIKVISTIQLQYSDTLASKSTIGNSIQGVITASSPAIVGELIIDAADSKSWVLDETTGPAFDLDVMDLINLGVPADVKVVHIQCHKIIEEVGDTTDPVRFELEIGATSIGTMSQFQMANIADFTPSALTVKNVEVQTGEKALLTVVFALDK